MSLKFVYIDMVLLFVVFTDWTRGAIGIKRMVFVSWNVLQLGVRIALQF